MAGVELGAATMRGGGEHRRRSSFELPQALLSNASDAMARSQYEATASRPDVDARVSCLAALALVDSADGWEVYLRQCARALDIP